MDYDLQTNVTIDSTGSVSYYDSSRRITQEVILTIFFIIGMFADVAIFYTIFCFKQIRTVPNILVANWAIADLLCLMVAPSGYRILSVIAKSSISHEFMCFLEEFGSTFHITVILFVIITLIDWFIAAHFGGASERFRNHYVTVIATIWLFAIIFAIRCRGHNYEDSISDFNNPIRNTETRKSDVDVSFRNSQELLTHLE
ncbi:hypothetical protein FQA39_LY14303 [Lamprigera yunnana]|nr:hypothetical protein FQA39_LY14303 [Lamprigera yunnana]